MIRRAIAHAIGYALAWALVLGLAMAGCRAFAGAIGPGDYVAPTLAPFPSFAPDTPAPDVPHVTDDPAATDAPAPVYDCGDADPDDPEIDPEWDCEVLNP